VVGLDEEDSLNTAKEYVKLVSKEGHEFVVSRDVVLSSGTIRAMLTGPGQWKEKSGPQATIHFEAISTHILEKVIQYFYYKKQYDGSTAPLPPFKLDLDTVVPLLLAANFLDT